MKKIVSLLCVCLLLVGLAGCGGAETLSSVKERLIKASYTVRDYDEEMLSQMSTDMYSYGAKGTLTGGIVGRLQATGDHVIVLAFESHDDLEIVYRSIKKTLPADERIDYCDNLLAYGSEKAVRAAF